MSLEENKRIARSWFEEVINKKNVAVIPQLFTEDAVFDYPLLPEPMIGPEPIQQFVAGVGVAFPDAVFTVDEVFGEEDRVAVRWSNKGTFTGPFLQFQPTGKKGELLSGVSIFHFEQGKVSQVWVRYNTASLLQQLGILSME